MSKQKKNEFDYKKYGKVAWFSALDTAQENGDFEKAALAQTKLKRLGVIVKFIGDNRIEQRQQPRRTFLSGELSLG